MARYRNPCCRRLDRRNRHNDGWTRPRFLSRFPATASARKSHAAECGLEVINQTPTTSAFPLAAEVRSLPPFQYPLARSRTLNRTDPFESSNGPILLRSAVVVGRTYGQLVKGLPQ